MNLEELVLPSLGEHVIENVFQALAESFRKENFKVDDDVAAPMQFLVEQEAVDLQSLG